MKMGQIGLNMFEHDGENWQYQPRYRHDLTGNMSISNLGLSDTYPLVI